MFWAIKPDSFRLSKRQHLADFFSWGTKDGTWDNTKGHMNEGIRTIIERREIKQALGPQCLGEPSWERQVRESAEYGKTGNSRRRYGVFRTLVLPHDRSVTHIGNEVRSVRKDQEV